MKKSETSQDITGYHITAKCNKEPGHRVHCYKCTDEEGHEKCFTTQEIIDLIEKDKKSFYTGSGDTKSHVEVVHTAIPYIRAHKDETSDNNVSKLPLFECDSN